jgi:hypothetical protein
MARNDWYTVYDRPEYYEVVKIDPDDRTPITSTYNPGTMPAYKVHKTNDKLSQCECWAGFKWCRHKKIIVEFQKLGRVNLGWLYNIDKNKWLEPLSQAQLEDFK